MSNTKENILQAALALFARNGYEATSVSDIAGVLGITKGALYKHYKNKQDIFDQIIERLFDRDRELARAHEMPEETYDKTPQAFSHTSAEHLISFMKSQYTFLTKDVFASSVRKMLTLEQYRNPDMAALYQSWLAAGPISYLEDQIREMMAQRIWKPGDPKTCAIELYAPLYLLLSLEEVSQNSAETLQWVTAHIEGFISKNTIFQTKENTNGI